MLFIYIVAGVLLLVLLVVAVVALSFLNLWLQARASGVKVTLLGMVAMRLRQVDPPLVVNAMIAMAKGGLTVCQDELEAHLLAGGDLEGVSEAAIQAAKAGLDIDFRRLAAIDLAGRNVREAVRTCVSPKVLTCPAPRNGADRLFAVCRDGIQLRVLVRVTVRTRIERVVGGAGEETIIARVGEGIVAAIGRADSHKDILAAPDSISRRILEHGLDSNTCFEILSVDIADVSVDENVGARLLREQADADKRVAQAQAEMRRAAAVAAQQEMVSRTVEMEARVVAARAVVPRGVAQGLRGGRLGRRRGLAPTQNGRVAWRPAVQ